MSAPDASADALRRALAAIKDLKERLQRSEDAHHEPIAVIGASCRFPGGANSMDEYWELLRAGRHAVGAAPSDRWDLTDLYDPDPDAPGKVYSDQGGFLEQAIDRFDAEFFGITPREANGLDPQQRLLLEVAWETLENAGVAAGALAGSSTGVFVGMGSTDYASLQVRELSPADIGAHFGTGVAPCVAAGRIAYFLGLRGPAVALDTACSSSLVAIVLAVQSLRSRSCRQALAGGVNVLIDPQPSIFLSRFRALSPTGRCHTFSAAADGYVRAEGCGLVVLKRLSDAEADGDRIMAVIRGAAMNHDGRSSGLTVPSGSAQREVIEQALTDGRLDPLDIDLVEAHGTGTELGDPIEVRALDAVYGRGRSAESPLLLGSAKTNIGHLEAAAGVAGLLKLVLALRHDEIPAHLHFDQPSPHIDWSSMPISVTAEGRPWPRTGRPRRAAVSAFGFSGTNAHVIVEEAPAASPAATSPRQRPFQMLTLSAKDGEARNELAERYVEHLESSSGDLPDLAWTAQTGRVHFDHRLAVVADRPEQAVERLQAWLADEEPAGVSAAQAPLTAPEVAFVYTGQGAQYPDMGRGLYEGEPVFRAAMDRCDELLRPALPHPLLDVLYGDDESLGGLVHQTSFTQPAMFAVQYGLAELWRSWGIVPAAVVGHSIGEYAAACLAGVFGLEDALALIAARGRLMGALAEGGAMVAVFASEETARALIEPHRTVVGLAACNGPSNVVVSGAEEAIGAIVAQLGSRGIGHRRLNVSHAFHSPLMAPMVEEFAAVAATVAFSEPERAFVSTVSGRVEGVAVAQAQYWVDQVTSPVRFGDAANALIDLGVQHFLEIGPQPTLLGMLARNGVAETSLHGSLRSGREDGAQMAEAVARLWVAGCRPDWTGVHGGPRRPVPAPTYPFQRKRYWYRSSAPRPRPATERIREWMYEVSWVPSTLPVSSAPSDGGSWLVVQAAGGDAGALVDELTVRGQHVVTVDGWDEQRLAPEVPPAGGWSGVVFAAVGESDGAGATDRRLLAQLLAATQSLLDEGTMAPRARLWLLTAGGQAVGERELVAPAQASLWGFANAVTVERPSLRTACIDLAPGGSDAVTAVVDELLGESDEDRVALRDGQRFCARLARCEARAEGVVPTAEGTYLVTGGLSGLGLEAAKTLASQGARHLVLVARTEPSAETVAVIEDLRSAGTDVRVLHADVSQRDQVEGVLRTVRETMPPLRGVLHAAGTTDDGLVGDLDWDRFEKVLRPKVDGAWHLHELTAADPLDHFILYSSVSSVFGAAGQANYAAANAFLDGLAHHRRAVGLAGVSINWGPWSTVGMAARLDEALRRRIERLGTGFINPTDGHAILAELLKSTAPQVAVVPVDWARVADQPGADSRPFLESVMREGGESGAGPSVREDGFADRLRMRSPEERLPFLREQVLLAIVAILDLEPGATLDGAQGLPDLGMDSLMAVELSNRLQRTMAIPLDSTVAFDWPTLDALTAHLAHLLGVAEEVGLEDGTDDVHHERQRTRVTELQAISEEEAEWSLLAELERSGY